ncbi:putative neural-cadherin 2 [Palaemon carinicauda]|uniref:putative neural-cadherin 2 n=1 Tax=Palaemon carinicauda TaxID=392227 RepID=UPI0035B5C4BC
MNCTSVFVDGKTGSGSVAVNAVTCETVLQVAVLLAVQYHLVVEVRAGEATSEAKIDIRVLDDNDHAPLFPRALHETQITEEDDRHLPKTILTQVTATDLDGEQYGHLQYSLTGDGVYSNGSRSSFAIDEDTGAIHLLRPLDRDPPNGRSQWHLKVKVTDGEYDAFTAVHVNLKDINDNAPFFPVSTINATISENTPEGASVAQVAATDNDDPREGHNARLVYSLEKNVIDEASGRPIFAVDSDSGLITTALCCLDREKTQRYSIQVVATDGGGLKGTGTVSVEVSDVNDVPPRFSRSEWTLDVSERLTPDNVLATLTVIDQDVSNNFTFRHPATYPQEMNGSSVFVDGKTGSAPVAVNAVTCETVLQVAVLLAVQQRKTTPIFDADLISIRNFNFDFSISKEKSTPIFDADLISIRNFNFDFSISKEKSTPIFDANLISIRNFNLTSLSAKKKSTPIFDANLISIRNFNFDFSISREKSTPIFDANLISIRNFNFDFSISKEKNNSYI